MRCQNSNKRIWKLIEGAASDSYAASAMAAISYSVTKMASGAELDTFDELVAEAMRSSRPGASVFGAIVNALRKDSAFSEWVDKLVPHSPDGKFQNFLDKLDEREFERILDLPPNRFEKLTREALESVKDEIDNSKKDKTDDKKEPEKTPQSTTGELERPDGTTVRVTAKGEDKETEEDDGEGDHPSDERPPTIYGEEDEQTKYLYAIAIDRIQCLEVTGYTLAGILSFGIAAATGVDDEIAFVSNGVARFKNGVRTPFLVPSEGVHENVSDGDVLSDRPEAVSPSDENELKLARKETFLVNRFLFRGSRQLGQAPVNMDMAPFDLDDFLRANIEFSLFEDDSDIKNAIRDLLSLLQQLTSIAQQVLTAAGGAPQIVTATLTTFDSSQAFRRLNEILQGLISSKDKIDSHDFIINGTQIKAAFEETTSIKQYPPGADPSSYDYVTDRPEQTAKLNGDGARYKVILRYERHQMR